MIYKQTLRGLLFGLLAGSAYLYPDPRVMSVLHRAIYPAGEHAAGAADRSRTIAEVRWLEDLYHRS